ncbi:MAG: hypothetical protein KAH18_13310 [Psychromonas sp.]|nr:hypothetical protein [Psychromonas sp.]
MNINKTSIFSWVVTLWIAKVFLFSLPYKFTLHPDTQHIFGIIGNWMKGYIGETEGSFFMSYGSYFVGIAELFTALILLSPAVFFALNKIGVMKIQPSPLLTRIVGGLFASTIMAGAVFFHMFTPLGIIVIHEGKSDGGSLFYAATSILILGLSMALLNLIKIKKG